MRVWRYHQQPLLNWLPIGFPYTVEESQNRENNTYRYPSRGQAVFVWCQCIYNSHREHAVVKWSLKNYNICVLGIKVIVATIGMWEMSMLLTTHFSHTSLYHRRSLRMKKEGDQSPQNLPKLREAVSKAMFRLAFDQMLEYQKFVF